MTGILAYIGIGSNLDGPRERVERACRELDALPGCRLVARSSIYSSAPMGPQDQPDYINAVAALDTVLEPLALLNELQALEQRHGRRRKVHWGPRTLDLDILLYHDRQIMEPGLSVPHPGLAQRNFVLYPLAEIAEGLNVPGLGSVEELCRQCADTGLARLASISNQ